ncbi:hypothetical protein Lsan_1360 [Legionella santicrucis]|uniref:Reverse transcriptase (RNA-dependent DNA polymerase) n=1 Tax=Legionella santicrucis TaxID=45074 RepID=A0A0W0Z285_9GAMM|nr:RNA-directed DNA polymerase [Legionella santicrucis]KTD63242.1 hypothetical protein Lsan_1360 [Legionella santicrucis]
MDYEAEFNGWEKLKIKDLIVAYRKAKADCFFENIFPTSGNFAEYERNLIGNLKELLKNLQLQNGFENIEELLGTPRLLPKKLKLEPKKDQKNGHVHFSKPIKEFESIKINNELQAEFRVIGDFPVNAHILSSLWINMIGHKFDAILSKSSYGSRLRRTRDSDNKKNAFHISAIGSFEPYFHPYQKWRKDGLKNIRNNLNDSNDVIAVSLDFKCFYHNIDPLFISSDGFLKELGEGLKLSKEEKEFNLQMSKFLKKWSDKASYFANSLSKSKDTVRGGLVVGLTATRIISNILLYKWDELIKEKITPIYYGRYVDDLFLVLSNPGTVNNINKLMKYLQKKMGRACIKFDKNNEMWEVNLGANYQKKSLIQFQTDKQKLFILEGQAGCDLINSIEKEMHELSSEYRLMPVPDQLEQSTAARVLSASSTTREQGDTLRRADGLTIRRLSWSLQLRHVEMLAKDLHKKEWENERAEFYQFAYNHILRPDRIFDNYIYLPRLLGFAISMNDWESALAIIIRSFESIELLGQVSGINRAICINSCEINAKKEVWQQILISLAKSLIESVSKYLNLSNFLGVNEFNYFSKQAEKVIQKILEKSDSHFTHLDILEKSKKMLVSDLANTPYKSFLTQNHAVSLLNQFDIENENEIFDEFQNIRLLEIETLKEFLNKRRKIIHNVNVFSPFLFPTRPYTPEEIADISPECVWPIKSMKKTPRTIWAKYVQVLRGVWIKPAALFEEDNSNNSRMLKIGNLRKNKIIVAITNLYLSESEIAHSACEKPSLTLKRYKRIAKLVNDAIHLTTRPDYLIFPELSIPIEWIPSITNRLLISGINLIAGTEYRHKKNNKIVSEACLSLIDNSLGYPSSIRIWQSKLQPAVEEERVLLWKPGKTWWKDPRSIRNPIYNHNNFHFGVMVCSELQNSKARVSFQGGIDSLMILSWNKDIETFSSLVGSAALDIHAYIVMVNNQKYGDSRVRVPSKQSFKRDLARLRGGRNDFLVAVELDIDALRAFQSRAKRWTHDEDLFKPVPEDYIISPTRIIKPSS